MPSPENKENGGAGFCAAPFFAGLDGGNLRPIFAREVGWPNESAF